MMGEADCSTPELVDQRALVNKNRFAMNSANRDELELDGPNLMRSNNKTRMISPLTRLLSCPIASRVSFLLGWVLTVVVVSYWEDYTERLLKLETHTDLATTDPVLTSAGAPVICEGRWVYVYNLSEVYNREFVRECATFKKGRDLCMYMENGGMGRGLRFGTEQGGPAEDEMQQPGPWHNTWQFALELYFHERLVRQYPCLTQREELANAFFVPYYAGMDLSRRTTHRLPKSELYLELAKWLQGRASWNRRQGRDHFMVLGRIASDFRRSGGDRAWGNEMLRLKTFKDMVVLSIERSSGRFRDSASVENEIAIPYPTYFHASSNGELRHLVDWLRQTAQRVSLVTMAAGQRQPTSNKMRHRLMAQCGHDPRCTLLLCVGHEASPSLAAEIRNVSLPVKMEGETLEVSCNDPPVLLSAMHQSVFCLQPPGDSPTRRSFFDAMLVGCIPVIFHKEAAWLQYVHHLPEQGASYSVFIPVTLASKSNVIDVLSKVDKSKISEMQANIAKLVPRILYAWLNEMPGRSPTPETTRASTPDAFDIAIETVLGRINLHEKLTRNESSSR